MKAVIYPNLPPGKNANPYIKDFVSALHRSGIQVGNAPHKNPLFSICFKKIDADFYLFHWIEDVSNHKFGYLQAFMAIVFLLRIRLYKKKIIWFLHNKEAHATKHKKIRKRLIGLLTKYSNHIITHASDGRAIIKEPFREKVTFIDHPTKNRITKIDPAPVLPPQFDLLIWGSISRYKGVLEFLQFMGRTNSTLKVNIVGECKDEQLLSELQAAKTDSVRLENKGASFEELDGYIRDAKFVLIPYHSASILSSGILMDSLSYGAKVIGPDTGSFKDYAESSEINVYTFERFEDIAQIISANPQPVSAKGYHHFLERNTWSNFVKRMSDIIRV